MLGYQLTSQIAYFFYIFFLVLVYMVNITCGRQQLLVVKLCPAAEMNDMIILENEDLLMILFRSDIL